MVLPNSHRIPRVPQYLGNRSRKSDSFYLQDYHLLRWTFPGSSVINQICNFPTDPKLCPIEPHDPEYTTLSGFNIYSVWAISSSLAATTEITIVFSSWGYLDVSVHLVRLWSLCIQLQMSRHYTRRVSPFRNLRIKACLAAPRSLSQLATSFIATWRQGIRRLPLIAWPQNNWHNHIKRLCKSISKLSKNKYDWFFYLNQKQDVIWHLVFSLVEVNGFEPMASCVQGRRSPSWATPPKNIADFGLRILDFIFNNPKSRI